MVISKGSFGRGLEEHGDKRIEGVYGLEGMCVNILILIKLEEDGTEGMEGFDGLANGLRLGLHGRVGIGLVCSWIHI